MSELPINPYQIPPSNPAILDRYSEEHPISLMEERAQAREDERNTLWRKAHGVSSVRRGVVVIPTDYKDR